MLKNALAVIVGYVVMAAVALAAAAGAYVWLGEDGAFRPKSFELSHRWIALSLAIGVVAALIGGFVCAWIARAARAALWLAFVLLAVGLAFAWLESDRPPPGPRLGPISTEEALANLRQPRWMAFTLPILGAASVLAGGRMGRRKEPTDPEG